MVNKRNVLSDDKSTKQKEFPNIADAQIWPIAEEDLSLVLSHKSRSNAGKKGLKKIKKTIEELDHFRQRIRDGATAEEVLALIKKDGEKPLNEEKEFLEFLLDRGEEIDNLITPAHVGNIRQSRDLIDNKLTPTTDTNQSTIFDFLEKREAAAETEHLKNIQTSIELDVAEERLVHTLSVLLARKGERWNQNSENYYMGNQTRGNVKIQGLIVDNKGTQPIQQKSVELATARLSISPHELYSTYYGKENYSGDGCKHVLSVLEGLAKKNFMVSLSIPQGNGKFQQLRTYQSLFKLFIRNKDLTESEIQTFNADTKLIERKNCNFLFKFSPLFSNNIRERYIEFPEDLHLRLSRAAGSKRISQCTLLLKDLLLREKQSGRCSILRDEETLIDVLRLSRMRKEGRKTRLTVKLLKSFDICQKMGLLKSFEESIGKKMQTQYLLEINPDFC